MNLFLIRSCINHDYIIRPYFIDHICYLGSLQLAAIPLHAHSKYAEEFARLEPLIHIEQLYLNRSLNLKYQENRHEAVTPKFRINQALQLQNLMYLFYVYGFILFSTGLVFLLEILIFKHTLDNYFKNYI